METIKVFNEQKGKTVELLEQLVGFLNQGKEFGIDIDPKFKVKLETGIKATENEKLRVALIGGFSEGKTSIAAAWAEKYDKASMKISQQESSNEVVVYQMENFDLIDTPGLFGYKETAAKEKYKDITKKYVSEAHLVLYVMNPNNPIKESHKEELLWLFNDLHLLPRTVFVLSRFDEEVDLEDDNDYQDGLRIKQKNIKERLQNFGITEANDDISIVAVSANPFGKGIEFWLSNMSEFKQLSRIESLQNATTEKIKEAGSSTALVEAAKKSIISDILKRELPVAIARDEKIASECNRFSQMCTEAQKELDKTKEKISYVKTNLKDFILKYFSDIILQLNGTSLETFSDFFERNIGSEGTVLNTRIENEFERQCGSVSHDLTRLEKNIDGEINQYNNVMGDWALKGAKMGASKLAKMTDAVSVIKIKGLRDILLPSFKFKPWGAVNLANNLNNAIPIVGAAIGIGLELWDSISNSQKEQKFIETKTEYKKAFEKQRAELIEFVNDDEQFIKNFFPDYNQMLTQVKTLKDEMRKKNETHLQFQKWREQGEAIEAEFQVLA